MQIAYYVMLYVNSRALRVDQSVCSSAPGRGQDKQSAKLRRSAPYTSVWPGVWRGGGHFCSLRGHSDLDEGQQCARLYTPQEAPLTPGLPTVHGLPHHTTTLRIKLQVDLSCFVY